ncbi:MAG: hypothetical protein MPN21_23080 [Thermoanaerobaculia bacterium]|nr:hypothetical protein [Thermoanaerobaculia bacterium]
MHRFPIVLCLVVCVCLSAGATTGTAQGESNAVDPVEDVLGAATFRHVGPVGNRVTAVVGVPGDANLYLAGAASGGVWKSTDGGHTWRPTFDDTGAASIGALAVAPSDANVVWAGTGEAFLRSNVSIGNGIYRSTDGGETWEHRGLAETGRISRIVIDPGNPDITYVAALGHVYGPQQERGVFRTRDGGETWEQTLFVDENTGASDLVIDPNNPRVLFAGMWQIEVRTHRRQSGGPGSGLWKSTDAGATWVQLQGGGLPEPPWGKVALTMSADDSRRVYALIETSSNRDFAPSDPYPGTLWRSDDGGGGWEMVNADNTLHQRPLYYSRMLAAPDDADEVHFMAVDQTVSIDGGRTVEVNNSGWDHHDIWIDPTNTDRRITAHDGGVSVTTDSGQNWYRPQLPIAQMYHVAVDRQIPYRVYGNRQDGFAARGPSRIPGSGEIPLGAWQTVGGCEVGFTVPHPEDSELVWAGCYDGLLSFFDGYTGMARDVSVWPEAVESWAGDELTYRFHWSFPLEISPHDGETVYVGSQYVHRTTNRGQSWEQISPDLTTADPELMRRTGGLTLDDAGPTLGPSIFAIAESPRTEGEIWVGTNDGQVQVKRADGSEWINVSANLDGAPELGTISNIEPSHHRDGVAYLTIDAHQEGDTAPYVYRTQDRGASWTKIVDGVEPSTFSYAHCVREDPVVPGLLYVGTEDGLYVSLDDGGTWQRSKSDLPPAPVHWIEIQEPFGDLVLATYGRGIQILDDLSALRAVASGAADLTSSMLFTPRPAYRFRAKEGILSQPDVPAAGSNPPGGAILHIYLAEEQNESPAIEVVAQDGRVFRTLGGNEDDALPKGAGVHRVVWDLWSDESTEVKLRTQPDENPHVAIPEKGWRPLSDGGPVSLLALPGTYTVRLRLGEEVVGEQPLEVRKDPTSGGDLRALAEQLELQKELWRMADRAAQMINEIEWMRLRIDQLEERFDSDSSAAEMLEAAEKVDEQLRALEGRFFDLRLTGARQDTLRWQRRLYSRLGYLAWLVGSSDERPTDSQVEVFGVLKKRFDAAEEEWRSLRQGAVQELDEIVVASGLGGLTGPT